MQKVRPEWDCGEWVLGMRLRFFESSDPSDGPSGLVINDLHADSPHLPGITYEDTILKVNGKSVRAPDQVRKALDSARGNGLDVVEVVYVREVGDDWKQFSAKIPIIVPDNEPEANDQTSNMKAKGV